MSRSHAWQLSRRAALRGAGLSIALPFLEQMLPRVARAQEAKPRRFVAVFKPNGCHMGKFFPAETGTAFTPTGTLAPLLPWKDRLVCVSGLQNKVAGPHQNLHLSGIAAALTGTRPERDRNAVSVDQVLASAWKGRTALPSLELGGDSASGYFKSGGICEGLPCKWALTMSYADANTPKPAEINPQAAFDRLFGASGPTGNTAEAEALAKRRRDSRKSMLDAVRGHTERLEAKLGVADGRRLDAYLTGLRELEARLADAAAPSTCQVGARPGGGLSYPDRIKAMMDIIALALQCDRTRVVTFMLAEGESENTYTFLNVKTFDISGDSGHHGTSHHGRRAEQLASLEKIDSWHVEQIAYLAGKLAAMREPDGSVLDNSIIMHTSDVSDGDTHSYANMPIFLLGGGGGALPTGRHVNVPGGRPVSDLYLTLLKAYGVDRAAFGNSTGTLSLG